MGGQGAVRLSFLDGLRGIAAMAVVLYHGWSATGQAHKPFGASWNWLFGYGWMGVQLFFLISGFVILMTLERRPNLPSFAWHRWLRLFPAMAIATAILYTWLTLAGRGVGGQVNPQDVIPGLTFINPSLIHSLTRIEIKSLEGAFWTLYVEVLFYAVFGILYVHAGRARAIWGVAMVGVLAQVAWHLSDAEMLTGLPKRIADAIGWMGFIHFNWFACGAAAYVHFRERRSGWLLFAIVMGGVAAMTQWALGMNPFIRALLLGVVALFLLALNWPALQRALSRRTLLYLGFISYPLYLVHAPIQAEMIYWQWKHVSWMPAAVTPLVPTLIAILLATWMARHGEPRLRALLLGMGEGLAGFRRAAMAR